MLLWEKSKQLAYDIYQNVYDDSFDETDETDETDIPFVINSKRVEYIPPDYSDNGDCPICYEKGVDLIVHKHVNGVNDVPHKFHASCIQDMLFTTGKRDCPLCRRPRSFFGKKKKSNKKTKKRKSNKKKSNKKTKKRKSKN